MIFTIVQIEDVEEAKALHKLAFVADRWVGDDHTFWVAYKGATIVGFCSAIYDAKNDVVHLSRAACVKSVKGQGLQRQMIGARVRWARKQGASHVVSYTTLKNYASMVNLLRCGFRFYRPGRYWVGTDVHYFRLALNER